MSKEFKFYCSEIWKGKSVLRAFLNWRLKEDELCGKTIDIGGGKNADYISFMNTSEGFELTTFDIKAGQKDIDFEKDALPADDGLYDTVLFLNVMEHIFNYQHIANEVVRIVKPGGGQLIGFVPFLMWYHPDHRDFFRYTHEAIDNILQSTGVTDVQIEVVGKGPFIAAAHMILLSFPRVMRVPLFVGLYFLDKIYKKLKKENARLYALGYYFKVQKNIC